MTLADELREGRPARVGCSVCTWLESQPAEDLEVWAEHLALPVSALPHTRALAAMRKRGYPFTSTQALLRHRRESH